MTNPHPKFSFDTVFDDAGDIAYSPPAAKRVYLSEEVETLRARALAEGERSVVARAEQEAAASLAEIAAATRSALDVLARLAHEHRTACAALSLAAARTIAGAALDLFPEAPAAAALEALAREIEATPRLIVRAAPALVERLRAMGHEVRELDLASGVHAIERVCRDAGARLLRHCVWIGAADPRREGQAAGR